MAQFRRGDRVQIEGEASDWDIGTVAVIKKEAGSPVMYDVKWDSSGDDTDIPEHLLYLVAGSELALDPAEPDMVNHPPHYNQHPKGIECIDVIEENPFPNLASAMKYLWRVSWGGKHNDEEDLRKAIWFINRELGRRGLDKQDSI